MYFELMQSRLVGNLRERVRSGAITERSLARLTGLSQSHLHNVLKGVRILSPVLADQVVARLHIGLRDLLRDDELGLERTGRRSTLSGHTGTRLVEGWIGPGAAFPDLQQFAGSIPFLSFDVDGAAKPVAVRLLADHNMGNLFHAGDLAVLASPAQRPPALDGREYFAIDTGGSSLIRRVELRGEALVLKRGDGSAEPVCIPLADRNILEVVRARVIWIGRYLGETPYCSETGYRGWRRASMPSWRRMRNVSGAPGKCWNYAERPPSSCTTFAPGLPRRSTN
jgi:hypothetical protein